MLSESLDFYPVPEVTFALKSYRHIVFPYTVVLFVLIGGFREA